jgi:hypothetical protein
VAVISDNNAAAAKAFVEVIFVSPSVLLATAAMPDGAGSSELLISESIRFPDASIQM